METSISMKTTDTAGKKNTTTLSYVNPNASNELLKTYAEKLASLTSDTYTGATKIEKTDLDEELPTKTARTVSLKQQTDQGAGHYTTVTSAIYPNTLGAFSTESNVQTFLLDYTGDTADTYLIIDKNFPFEVLITPPYIKGEDVMSIALADEGGTVPASVTSYATVGIAETANYQAGEFVITIQGGEG